ncbi:hypothetical protein ACFQY4_04730 [Catellatospora bangladeshensis]|uniref:hypothetical protein n=1 Tax=Catellatospora bangladeshensis TaxID=310355 RepID=UPI0036155BC5
MDRAAPSAARRPRDQALPLRPLTLGELLDAAAELVRRRAGVLPAAAAVLALAEQAVLVPGRDTVGVVLSAGLPELSSGYWQLLALGAGFEALIIVWLGLLTGRGVATALTSQVPRKGLRERLRGAEAVAVGGLIAAVPAALGAFLGPLWLLGYPCSGWSGSWSRWSAGALSARWAGPRRSPSGAACGWPRSGCWVTRRGCCCGSRSTWARWRGWSSCRSARSWRSGCWCRCSWSPTRWRTRRWPRSTPRC